MDDKIKIAANEIVKKISALPSGTEFKIADFLTDYKFDTRENFKLMEEILSLCELENVEIENIPSDMILGLPWVYKYRKNN